MSRPDPQVVPLTKPDTPAQAGAGCAAGAAVGTGFLALLWIEPGGAVSQTWGGIAAAVLAAILMVCGPMVSSARSAAWLEGTALVVRWMRTRRCELSTAEAAVEHVRERTRWGAATIHRLVVRDPASGVRLCKEVGIDGTALVPRTELELLAGALTAGRPEDAPARRVADELCGFGDPRSGDG